MLPITHAKGRVSMTMKLLSAALASALLLPTAALTAGAATQIDEMTIEVHMPDIYTSYAPAELVSVPDGADYAITYAAYYDDRVASTDALRFTADGSHDLLLTVQTNSGYVLSDDVEYWFDGGGLSITDATLIQAYLAEFASDYPISSRVTFLVD